MRTVLAARACTILHDLLRGRDGAQTFLLPANICPIVPITFFKAGLSVEFVDISAETLNIDLGEVENLLMRHPQAYAGVLYSHTYGDPSAPEDRFREIKARHPQLLLIDDRCLCVPDLQPSASSAADVILYSTGYAKIVDIGFGGYAYIRDEVDYWHRSLPFDRAALDAVEAAYKSCVNAGEAYRYVDSNWLQTEADLPGWDEYRGRVENALKTSMAHRQALNAVYNSRIPSRAQLTSNFQLWRFNVRVTRKKQSLDAIFSAGLFASSHYAPLDGIMGSGGGQNARALSDQVINLFNDQHYSLEMAERTAEIVVRSLH